MRAIRVDTFGDPSLMVVKSLGAPVPVADQVVVAIQAAGVNPVDTYIRAGVYGRLPALPYTPGIDGAGVVAAVGEAVTTLQVGDPVYGGWPLSGTYAEKALYEATQVFPLPDTLSFAEGASIFVPYSTAYKALFINGQAKPGETVLIHGATGGVGLAAIQLAVAAGLRVIATGGTSAGRQLAEAQGAHLVLDHHAPDYREDAVKFTQQQGLHLILEMLANVNLGHDLELLQTAGRVVIIGSRGEVTINPRTIMAKEAVVTGFTLFNTPAAVMAGIQSALRQGFQQGHLRPVVRQEYPLAEAAIAHQQVMTTGAQGNIVLLP